MEYFEVVGDSLATGYTRQWSASNHSERLVEIGGKGWLLINFAHCLRRRVYFPSPSRRVTRRPRRGAHVLVRCLHFLSGDNSTSCARTSEMLNIFVAIEVGDTRFSDRIVPARVSSECPEPRSVRNRMLEHQDVGRGGNSCVSYISRCVESFIILNISALNGF